MAARGRAGRALAGAVVLAAAAAGCSAGGGAAEAPRTITVFMVDNPQMVDLQGLTAEFFTPRSGITVDFTVLAENDARDRISEDFEAQGGQYDVATISNYEVPFYAGNGWVAPLDGYADADAGYDRDDVLAPIAAGLTGADGRTYAAPFYGESSFLMYRTDLLAAAGAVMPERPTWDDVARIAEQVDDPEGTRAICLRGLPGWGQVFAPLTTVVNTFGGTWWDADWNARVDSPEFTEAVQFYVDLVQQHGEEGAAQAGYVECLNNMLRGDTAMWYDATSAAGILEAEDSPVRGKIGYAPAPVARTDSSGWLYTWAWGVQAASTEKDDAWEFVSWASSQEYEELVGREVGWSEVPAGKRASTYRNPEYQASASAFYAATEAAISSADPADPGVQPRPAPGIQFVAIPEFADTATRVSQSVSAAIAEQATVEEALGEGQVIAQAVGDGYREREREGGGSTGAGGAGGSGGADGATPGG